MGIGDDDHRICGFAQRDMALLSAGDGDRKVGRLRLALRAFEKVDGETAVDEPGWRGLGLRRAEAAFEVGEAYDGLGDRENAESWFERALAVRAFRESESWAHACLNHALRYLWRGDFARAEGFAREAVEQVRSGRRRDEFAFVSALETQASALVGVGRSAEALAPLEEAMRFFRASAGLKHLGGIEFSILLVQGRAYAALGRVEEALRTFDEAEAKSATCPTRDRLDILLASAETRRAAGRSAEALERARLACAWWDRIIEVRRSGGFAGPSDVAEAERERAALAATWGL
jgi:tetratricopeptide (TPR) repeat protein